MHKLFDTARPYSNLRARANHILQLHQDGLRTERDEAARQLAHELLQATEPRLEWPATAAVPGHRLPSCALPVSPRYLTTANGN